MKTTLLAALLVPFLLACGDDVVNYSAPVGITGKLRSADPAQTAPYAFTLSKNITTEQGNPYGAFVNDATRVLGQPPSRIAVTYLTLELLPSSTGVTNLNQVFAGQVSVGFDLDGTAYPVGTAANPAGASFPMMTAFDSAGVGPAAFAELAGGTFPVILAGTAQPAFVTTGGLTADLQTTFGFVAYK